MNLKSILFLSLNLGLNAAQKTEIKDDFIQAIILVESGGRKGIIKGDYNPATKTYLAKGPFQIHFSCWKDAINFDPKIGGKYDDCFDLKYSKKVFISYQKKYAKKTNLKEENMAKLWNGGCNYQNASKTPAKAANLTKYWSKVQRELTKLRKQ
jgi:hypothetical protein